jgi:ERCC4-type nuclease
MKSERQDTGLVGQIKHIILCDTREKKRLEFRHPDIAFTKKQKLLVGDYCIRFSDGYIPPVIFERKGVGDLFGTLTGNYDRFKSEVLRSREAGIILILIIEGTLSKVLKGYKHINPKNPGTRIHIDGLRIIRTLFSLYVRYEVTPVFCKDREEMQNYIIEYYLAIWRKRQGKVLVKKES